MKLIAHRGNIDGPNLKMENKPEYLLDALSKGYDIETDVWGKNGELWVGHDEPIYKIKEFFGHFDYLGDGRIWYHCKNIEALIICEREGVGRTNFFFHDSDDFTLTSNGHIWTFPGKPLLSKKSISVLPERTDEEVPKNIYGICSDFIGLYID